MDFLPALAWKKTKSSDYFYHVFTELHALLTQAGQMQARVDYDPASEQDPVPGSRTTDFAHFIVDQLPGKLVLKTARKGIEAFSTAIGHDLSYDLQVTKAASAAVESHDRI